MKKPDKNKKNRQRKKKTVVTDGIHAFMLVALIVIFALCLSLTVVSIRSTLDKKPQTVSNETVNTETTEIPSEPRKIEQPQPEEVSVPSVSPPTQPQRQPLTTRRRPQAEEPRTTSARQPSTDQIPPSAGRDTVPSRPSAPDTSAPAPNTSVPDTAPASKTAVTAKPVESKGTIVFVIDDAGNNLRELEPFLNIPGPLTIAVLPGLPYSAEAARRIRAAGKEAILHQPMEAIGGQDPGPGAIYSGMSHDEIKAVLTKNIDEVGPVRGINNHQGSKITMDAEIMQTILTFCKENNLYFLDSRTTADSVVPAVARRVEIKITERNVFIDNEQNKNAMLRYITGGLTRAQTNGLSVMIGHTWSPDLAPLLKEQYPLLTQQGYTIKTASDIVK